MSGFNNPIGSPSIELLTESVDVTTAFKHWMSRLRRKARYLLCIVFNGGHELYRARTETKLFQQCILCGYETTGWTIDRRDRRLHLVTNKATSHTATRR